MSQVSSSLNAARSYLSTAGGYSGKAAGGFSSLQGLASGGAGALSSARSAANWAVDDTPEVDSSGAGEQGRSGISDAGGAAQQADSTVSDVASLTDKVKDALRDALSAARDAKIPGLNVYSLESTIESALSDQARADNQADSVDDAIRQVGSSLARAADAAGYVSNDGPEKDISDHAHSMGSNVSGAVEAFSDLSSSASSGESYQNSVSSSISSAMSAVDSLEQQLQRLEQESQESERAEQEHKQQAEQAERERQEAERTRETSPSQNVEVPVTQPEPALSVGQATGTGGLFSGASAPTSAGNFSDFSPRFNLGDDLGQFHNPIWEAQQNLAAMAGFRPNWSLNPIGWNPHAGPLFMHAPTPLEIMAANAHRLVTTGMIYQRPF